MEKQDIVENTEEVVVESDGEVTEEQDYQSPTIGELFGGHDKSEEPAEPVETKEDEPTEEPKAEPVKEEAEAEPVEDKKDNPLVKERDAFKMAMLDEKRKRQELEDRLEALERSKQTSETDEEEPYIDPETKRYLDKQLTAKEQKITLMKVEMSQELVRSQYKDYDDVVAHFNEAAKSNPKLLDMAVAAANPALYAYKEGRRLQFSKEYGDDPETIEKKILERHKEQMRKDLEKELMGKVAAKSKQPTNLTRVRAAGGEKDTDWKPTPIDRLFG